MRSDKETRRGGDKERGRGGDRGTGRRGDGGKRWTDRGDTDDDVD